MKYDKWHFRWLWPMAIEELEEPHTYYAEWMWDLGHEHQLHGHCGDAYLDLEKIWIGPLFFWRIGMKGGLGETSTV